MLSVYVQRESCWSPAQIYNDSTDQVVNGSKSFGLYVIFYLNFALQPDAMYYWDVTE